MNLAYQLALLETADLVRRANEVELAYQFKNALTQDAAYQQLLKHDRAYLHGGIARAYESLYADRHDEYAALLVLHYAEAGDDAKTLEYASLAGDLAARQYANAEALVQYGHALEAAKRQALPSEPLIHLYLRRGRVLELTGQLQKALLNYEELESLAAERSDRSMELAALVARATIYSTFTSISDPAHARALSNRALELAREIGDRKTEARVLWNLMLLSTILSEMPQAIEYAERSLAISRELGMREQTALTLNDLSRPYLSLGEFELARTAMEEALVIFRETDNQPMLTDCLGRFAGMNLATGKFDQMLEAAQAAQQVSDAIGNPWGQSFSRLFVGQVCFERGDISRAYTCISECIHFAEQSGFSVPLVKVRSELALLYGALGKVRQGIELAEQARAFALEHLPDFECKACVTLARLYTLSGDLVQAEANLKRASATLKEDFPQQVVDQLPVAEMEIALARKDYARALKTAGEAIEHFGKIRYHTFHGEVHFLQAQALRALGNEPAAREVFIQARAEADQIGSRWLLWQIHAALGERAQAREHIEYIAAHAPPELRESFLAKPQVHAVIQA